MVYSGIALVVLIFLMRFRFLLVIALGLGLLIVMGYWLYQTLVNRQRERKFARSPEGQIELRRKKCETALERLSEERDALTERIDKLEGQLLPEMSEGLRQETEGLIQDFKREHQLRVTKIEFYTKLLNKMETLLRQHRWQRELSENKKALEELREKHYDEIADMENLRWDVEKESSTLETIHDLSRRMEASHELDDALHLQRELERMTREL